MAKISAGGKAAKRKVGRPTKPEKDLRKLRFAIAVSAEEKSFLLEAAEKIRAEHHLVWGRHELIQSAERILGRQLPLPKRWRK